MKCVAEMGDAQNMLEPHPSAGGGEEDESGEEEVWESVSELASDEGLYVRRSKVEGPFTHEAIKHSIANNSNNIRFLYSAYYNISMRCVRPLEIITPA